MKKQKDKSKEEIIKDLLIDKKYKLLNDNYKPIGKGCSGYVYIIEYKKQLCALKVILNKSDNGEQNTSSEYKGFENEVDILIKINECQNSYFSDIKIIPKYYKHFTYTDKYNNDFYCIIMEPFEGNLSQLMDNIKDKKDEIILIKTLIILQTQLELIHERCNICIYDIKPKNILYKYISKYEYILVFSDTGLSELKNEDEECEDDLKSMKELLDKYKLDNGL